MGLIREKNKHFNEVIISKPKGELKMKTNEIMNNEEIVDCEVEDNFEDIEDEANGLGTIPVIAVGVAGLAAGVVAGVKLVPKGVNWVKGKIADRKAKKNEEEPETKKSKDDKYVVVKKEDNQ